MGPYAEVDEFVFFKVVFELLTFFKKKNPPDLLQELFCLYRLRHCLLNKMSRSLTFEVPPALFSPNANMSYYDLSEVFCLEMHFIFLNNLSYGTKS